MAYDRNHGEQRGGLSLQGRKCGGGGGYRPGKPPTPFGVSFTGGGGSSLAVTGLWTSVNYRKGVRCGNGVVIIQILQ